MDAKAHEEALKKARDEGFEAGKAAGLKEGEANAVKRMKQKKAAAGSTKQERKNPDCFRKQFSACKACRTCWAAQECKKKG